MGYFCFNVGLKTVLGSTHVVEQLSFSMFPSILTFDLDSILGSFLTFWGPNWLFWRSRKGSKTFFVSTNIVEQLSFSLLPSILTFDFDLISGHFWHFGALIGYFWGWSRVQQLFWGLLIKTNDSCVVSFALVLLYHVVLRPPAYSQFFWHTDRQTNIRTHRSSSWNLKSLECT